MKIKDLAVHDKPRERLFTLGVGALSDAELLAILLSTGNKDENVLSLSQKILSDISVSSLKQSPSKLLDYSGVGKAKVATLLAAIELGQRSLQEKSNRIKLDKPQKVFTHLQHLQSEQQEHFVGLYLDSRKQLLGQKILFIGTSDAAVVHPREVFAYALELRAHSVIVVHNHPSGDAHPSEEDIAFTKRLQKVGNTMCVKLVDHIIIGDHQFYSLSKNFLY